MKGKNCNHCGKTITPGADAVICEEHYRTATAANIEQARRIAELENAMTNAARNQSASNEENRQIKTALTALLDAFIITGAIKGDKGDRAKHDVIMYNTDMKSAINNASKLIRA